MALVRPCNDDKRQTATRRDLDRASLSDGGDRGTATRATARDGDATACQSAVEDAATSAFGATEAAVEGSSGSKRRALKRRGMARLAVVAAVGAIEAATGR
ncbi:hypothetical protein BHE74_00007836 [Ensete ventricosum]|nr:hypothetical protein GW17_00061147 [Ensete ventricosum]RWW83651.1 hypothetical protein BHE74_00007836 [Ensete ventricosum]RZS16736.1 hypothetical protein BHM03_00048772 [Ensete ventricosum]